MAAEDLEGQAAVGADKTCLAVGEMVDHVVVVDGDVRMVVVGEQERKDPEVDLAVVDYSNQVVVEDLVVVDYGNQVAVDLVARVVLVAEASACGRGGNSCSLLVDGEWWWWRK